MKKILFLLLVINIGWVNGQESIDQTLPVFQGKDLKIDVKRLHPFRLQYSPRSKVIDSLFRNAQVSHTVERGDYFGKDGKPKKGIRIRWVSNTHSFEDMAYVDAETFRIIKNTAVSDIRKESYVHAYFGNGFVSRTVLKNDSVSTSTSTKLKYNDYYHLILMPYLFTSSDLEAGTKFQLPYYSAVGNKESLIKVNIIGSKEYVDKYGQTKKAWRVDTDHGYARLEWYIDKFKPPYLLAYKWITMKAGKPISESKESVAKWWEYHGDDFDKIIIEK